MKINGRLTNALKDANIYFTNEMLLWLLACYFKLDFDLTNLEHLWEDVDKLVQTKIINRTYNNDGSVEIDFIIPLFEEEESKKIDLSWLQEYRDIFKGLKSNSMGSKSGCYKKMTKFLKTHPDVTPEDILKAARYHVNNTSPKYVRRADYFIDKDGISDLESCLEEMVNYYEDDLTDVI